MRQIRRAVEIGIGARSGREIELITGSLKASAEFEELMGNMRSYIIS